MVGGGGKHSIDLAQNMDNLRAIVNKVMKIQVSQNSGNFLSTSGAVSVQSMNMFYPVI